MDNFPNAHTVFSSSWVFITNLMEILQLIIVASSLYHGKRQDSKYLLFKTCLSCFSCMGMINFVILGSYVPCHCTSSWNGLRIAQTMTMEECLQSYDENFCFERKSEKHLKDSLLFWNVVILAVVLRKYSHCPVLHPIRGFGEVIVMGGMNGSLWLWCVQCFI